MARKVLIFCGIHGGGFRKDLLKVKIYGGCSWHTIHIDIFLEKNLLKIKKRV